MRQVTHALLTRPPLGILKSIRKLQSKYLVRLACVRHAASVHPEPGSNSHVISFYLYEVLHEYYVKAQFEAEGFELPRWVVQIQNLAWLILNRSTVLLGFVLNVLIHGLNQRPFLQEFSGFYILFSFQGTLFRCCFRSQQQLVYSIIPFPVCQELFKTFFEWLRSFLNDS